MLYSVPALNWYTTQAVFSLFCTGTKRISQFGFFLAEASIFLVILIGLGPLHSSFLKTYLFSINVQVIFFPSPQNFSGQAPPVFVGLFTICIFGGLLLVDSAAIICHG